MVTVPAASSPAPKWVILGLGIPLMLFWLFGFLWMFAHAKVNSSEVNKSRKLILIPKSLEGLKRTVGLLSDAVTLSAMAFAPSVPWKAPPDTQSAMTTIMLQYTEMLYLNVFYCIVVILILYPILHATLFKKLPKAVVSIIDLIFHSLSLPMISALLSMFACNYDEDNATLMRNPEVECWKGTHVIYVLFSVGVLVPFYWHFLVYSADENMQQNEDNKLGTQNFNPFRKRSDLVVPRKILCNPVYLAVTANFRVLLSAVHAFWSESNATFILPSLIIYNVFVQVVAYIGSPFSVDQLNTTLKASMALSGWTALAACLATWVFKESEELFWGWLGGLVIMVLVILVLWFRRYFGVKETPDKLPSRIEVASNAVKNVKNAAKNKRLSLEAAKLYLIAISYVKLSLRGYPNLTVQVSCNPAHTL